MHFTKTKYLVTSKKNTTYSKILLLLYEKWTFLQHKRIFGKLFYAIQKHKEHYNNNYKIIFSL